VRSTRIKPSAFFVVAALLCAAGAAPASAWRADGATIDPNYLWVQPPPDLDRANTIPIPTTLVVTGDRNAPSSISTEDRQLVLRVDRSSLPDRPVVVTMTPVTPTAVRDLPDGIEAVGNAYRIETRQLDRRSASFDAAAVLVTPEAADTVYGLGRTGEWSNLGPAAAPVTVSLPQTLVLGRAASDDSPARVVFVAAGAVLIIGGALVALALRRRRAARRES
jgi:hypothetical protein